MELTKTLSKRWGFVTNTDYYAKTQDLLKTIEIQEQVIIDCHQ